MRAPRLDLVWHSRTSAIPDWLWREAFGPPREGLFWFRCLEAAKLEDQFEFHFGELREEGTPIGIVPAFVFDVPLELVMPPALARILLPFARGPLRGLAHQRTFFIGSVAGEEGAVGLVPGRTLSEVAAFVHDRARAKARERGAPMLVWKDFAQADRPALDALSPPAFRVPSYPGTMIALHREGYGAFLAGLRAEPRRRIALRLRRGAQAAPAEAAVLVRPDEAQLAEIFALFEQTYARARTRFERLTPEFFRAIARCEEASFVVLRDTRSGGLAAFMLLLDLGERVINRFIGIDYAVADAYLYFRLFAAAYDRACRTRATCLHSGQTGYRAKVDTGHALVPLWNYCEHRSPLVHALFRRVARTISWKTLDPQLAEYLAAHPERLPG